VVNGRRGPRGGSSFIPLPYKFSCLSLSLPWPIGPSQVHNYSLSLFDSGPIPHFRASTAALAPSTARFSIAMARGSGGLAP
jgi:hypothetical protein